MANQTQIPVIQSMEQTITQLQQNANKVLRNLNNQIEDLQNSLSEEMVIGEIKIANLTEVQFQATTGTNWLLCNGQSCVNTSYSSQTGNNIVPNFTVSGINTFIRVN